MLRHLTVSHISTNYILDSILSTYITYKNYTIFFNLPQDNYTLQKIEESKGNVSVFAYVFLITLSQKELISKHTSRKHKPQHKNLYNSYHVTEQKSNFKVFFPH